MKVIFLDIDGVLCLPGAKPVLSFSPAAVVNINQIIRETGADLVISSTWRKMDVQLGKILHDQGVRGDVIGKTPEINGAPRGTEIEAWLDTAAPKITKFVIIDDDSDMGSLSNHLVRTNPRLGLTEVDALRAIGMLGRVDK